METFTLALLLGSAAGAATALGGAAILFRHWPQSYLHSFMALGCGFMLATALLEMVPHSLELGGEWAAGLILAGYLIVHFFEHAVTPHFHFGEETHSEHFVHAHTSYSVLFGLGIHSFFDGIAIGAGFAVSHWLGWIIFLAVALHKLPEGFTIASVMLAAGRTRRQALAAAVGLGAVTLAGVLLMGVFSRWVTAALPLSAGAALYVAASDLMPEVNKQRGWKMAVLVFFGVGAVVALQWFFEVH